MVNFVLITDIIENIILDIRYYTQNNFIGERIDGYEEPLAILTKEAAIALRKANDEFVSKGYCIKVYDAYRPQRAVNHFIRWVKNYQDIRMKKEFYPNLDKSKLIELGYIAEKSSHSRGSSIDLTLVDIKTKKELDMGGKFDFFDESSHLNYYNLTEEQSNNRMLLQNIMISKGFIPLKEEWWHFTLKNEPFPDTYFDFLIKRKIE